jgi:putative ABC transport system substrate-binding protein
MFDMRRREFITLLGGAATAWPLGARAQQPAKMACIGVLASLPLPPLQRLSRKLRAYGYVEGQNVRFEPRFAEGGTIAIRYWRPSWPHCRSTSS